MWHLWTCVSQDYYNKAEYEHRVVWLLKQISAGTVVPEGVFIDLWLAYLTYARRSSMTITCTGLEILILKFIFSDLKKRGFECLFAGTTSRFLLCRQLLAAKSLCRFSADGPFMMQRISHMFGLRQCSTTVAMYTKTAKVTDGLLRSSPVRETR